MAKANGGAPGVDGATIEDFPGLIRSHWPRISQTLLDGKYEPSAVKRVMIPKRSGGERPLGIPTVQDRVIQQAIQRLGFTFYARGRKVRWPDQAFLDFKHRVRKLTGRSRGASLKYRFQTLARYVRGWMTIRQDRRIGRCF
ncbi:MAG: hypothetical protein HZA01_00620 [Nitrospinae bacterium]|nr:hypothetical protein [Nitrospinota bacterium]